jgi:hypothetical protein
MATRREPTRWAGIASLRERGAARGTRRFTLGEAPDVLEDRCER